MAEFVKTPCKHCPYRRDVKPFLTMERAVELAYLPLNPYNSFYCHKTLDHDDEGEVVYGERTLECAGFLTLRAQDGEPVPDDFEPAWDLCYGDPSEMIQAYEEAEEQGEL